jgi:transcriptional regulator with XRE-family HTH domain
MCSPEATVGQRIQVFRRKRGMTLQRLAELTNLSKSLLSKIENGKVSSPVSTLFKIAQAFQAKVADFFDEAEGSTPLVIVKKGDGFKFREKMPYWVYECEALAYKRQKKIMEPFLTMTNRRTAGRVFFTHPGEEVLFVLEGKIKFIHGGKEWRIGRGDCAYFDATIPHIILSADGRAVKALMVSSNGLDRDGIGISERDFVLSKEGQ